MSVACLGKEKDYMVRGRGQRERRVSQESGGGWSPPTRWPGIEDIGWDQLVMVKRRRAGRLTC